MSELGALALRFALPVALFGAAAGVAGGVSRRPEWAAVAERAVWAVATFVLCAMLVGLVKPRLPLVHG